MPSRIDFVALHAQRTLNKIQIIFKYTFTKAYIKGSEYILFQILD